MESWYVIQPQPTMNSGFENEEWDNYVPDAFDEVLTETKLGQTVLLCNGLYNAETGEFETEFETQAVIQNVTPDAYTQGWKRQILTRISDMLVNYKYIKVKDTKDDWQIYLIMTMPDQNHIYTKAVIHECNYTLRWQDNQGIVYNYPCFIEDASQYNSGVNDVNSVIRTPYNQLMCWVSFDDNTIGIKRDKRMFVDYSTAYPPEVYKITSTSKVPYSYNDKRIIRLLFTEDMYNPDTDNLELLVCDYYSPSDIPQSTIPIEISYNGNPEIKIGGRKTFKIKGETPVVFSLLNDTSLADKISLEQTGNQCVIRCVNDTNIVGSHFKLIANTDGEQSELLITIKGVM